uniref:Serpin domain-containing protein n=1 Tax=Setaria italica TaxID=4555 RepID=K3XTB2_SETIT
MSSPPRWDGWPETDGDDRTPVATRTASRGIGGGRPRDANTGRGQGAGNLLSFGATPPGPWFAFAPPHPCAPPLRQHVRAPVFAQPPRDPFPWSTPVFANPFDDPRLALTMPCPWGPPSQVPFGGSGGGAAAPKGGGGDPGVLFPGSARPVRTDCDADGGASCLPLARQVALRTAGGGEARNFIVSPLSFHAALALVAAGTRGETQRELLSFLGSDSLDDLCRAAATVLVGRLPDVAETASFACGVWVDRNRFLTPEFANTAASRYAAVAEPVDFSSEPEMARRRVNAFVSEATKGLITDVLPPGSVDSSTVLVLANALYFKGTWARPFDPFRTFTAPFHLPGGDTVSAPFMTANLFNEQLIAVFPGFKALKLPYKSGGGHQAAFHMLLLLPDGEALKIGDLYDRAVSTPGFIRKHTPVDEVTVGRFMVPKFKFTFDFEASEDMKKLGVTRAFRGGDFSGMVTSGDGLFISGVYHKATIEVDELGTVAAAATAQCARMARLPPVDFVADRPFLFAIVEERSGVVMFLGHVVNPLAG